MELLREYARQNSESAFAELVCRHINLVYSAALRHVGIAAQAEEITQAVFVILARKSASLREDQILDAWLFETTRLTALSFLRGERRRQFREQEAYMQSILQESMPDPVWQQLAPLLDDAMMRLSRRDREAVVLRFFKGRNLGEVAAALNMKEPAAQKRVSRALEKLRKFFSKRGIDSTTAAIAENISAHSVQTAPVALAKAVTAIALAKGAVASASTLTLIKGALKLMAWTKTKTAIVAGVIAILVTGPTIVTVKQIQNHVLNHKIATTLLEMRHQWATNDYHAKGMTVPRLLDEQGKIHAWSAGILGAYVEYSFQKDGTEWRRDLHIFRANTNSTTWALSEFAAPMDTNLQSMAWEHKLITVTGEP